jgi:serine/alanine adding enzyme
VLCAPGAEGQDALDVLLRTYVQEVDGSPLFTELRNLSDMEAWQPTLQKCDFGYEDHLNYLIDLDRSPEDILSSVGSRTRKHIRRGLRRGEVIIEEVKGKDGVAACYDILRRTYSSAEVPLGDRSLFEAAFDVLYLKNMVRFTVARVDQAVVAVSGELLYKDVIYGWYGGLDRDYGSYMPNELLMWNILEWGAESGYKVYDFGGAGKPDEEYGVRDFKAKFGGKLVCFGRNTFIHAPRMLWLSERGYRLLHRWL